MWILWLLSGFFIGLGIGFILAAWAASKTDQDAVDCGVIKLCGKLYVIKAIEL